MLPALIFGAAVIGHGCGGSGPDTGCTHRCVGSDKDFDCAMRAFALELGVARAGAYAAPSLHDALGLGDLCNVARPPSVIKAHLSSDAIVHSHVWLAADKVYHVAPSDSVSSTAAGVGRDDDDYGKSRENPMTLAEAVNAVRSRAPHLRKTQSATILLHGGTYYGEAIELGSNDGGGSENAVVVWAAAPGEIPIISGGGHARSVAIGSWTVQIAHCFLI